MSYLVKLMLILFLLQWVIFNRGLIMGFNFLRRKLGSFNREFLNQVSFDIPENITPPVKNNILSDIVTIINIRDELIDNGAIDKDSVKEYRGMNNFSVGIDETLNTMEYLDTLNHSNMEYEIGNDEELPDDSFLNFEEQIEYTNNNASGMGDDLPLRAVPVIKKVRLADGSLIYAEVISDDDNEV